MDDEFVLCDCDELVAVADYECHVADQCPHRPQPCTWCNELVRGDRIEDHRISHCPARRMDCRRCGRSILADVDEVVRHYNTECGSTRPWVECDLCHKLVEPTMAGMINHAADFCLGLKEERDAMRRTTQLTYVL
jgi:hypothetical protein